MKIALFPGSFDPITRGHEEIVRRGLRMFDKIIIGIGINSEKKYFFTLEQRMDFIRKTFEKDPQVEVASYPNLTAEFAASVGAGFLLRGLRSGHDLEYERPVAIMNHKMAGLESVFLLSSGETSHISSTIVREMLRYHAPVDELVPAPVAQWLSQQA